MSVPPDPSSPRTRRVRYAGKNPRAFYEKYKELNPERFPADVEKIVASGKTPAGMHLPIMVAEVLDCLRPEAGDVAVDCTLGGGGHARAILEHIRPGGRLIGLDVDPLEQPRTEARLRADGFGSDVFVARQATFAGLPQVLAAEGIASVNVAIADLGVSSMQIDNPDRGFSYKAAGPLDMRMNPSRGESAWQLLERLDEDALSAVLAENADEPYAEAYSGENHRRPGAPGAHDAQHNLSTTGEDGRQDVGASHVPGAAGGRQPGVLVAGGALTSPAPESGARWPRGDHHVPLR